MKTSDNLTTAEIEGRSSDESDIVRQMAELVDAMKHDQSESATAARDIVACLKVVAEAWGDQAQSEDATQAFFKADTIAPVLRLTGDVETTRFEVKRMLGHGGFGVVLLAFDRRLGREVALKIPRPEIMVSRQVRERFLREAQAAAALDHPNVVPVYDVGDLGPIWFISSRYIAGPTLAEWLRDNQRTITSRDAAQLVATLADAVQHAHSRGVLHRDLKPGNVLLEPIEAPADIAFPFSPRLSDFGLAKRLDGQEGVTTDGALLGTPAYMAPEQAACRHHDVGISTDVYALGVILYELLAGKTPFRGDTEWEVLRKIQYDPVPLDEIRSRMIPADLQTICLKCLEKPQAQRYETAGQLAADLRRYLAGEPILARPVGRAERAWRWCRRNRTVAALLAAVTTLMLTAIAILAASNVRISRERAEAEAQRDRADANYQQSRRIVDRVLDRAADELAVIPHTEEVRKTVLKDALEFYGGFVSDLPSDPNVRFQAVMAYRQMADIAHELGNLRKRDWAFEKSHMLLSELVTRYPTNDRYARELSNNQFGYERIMEVWISLEDTYQRDKLRVHDSEQMLEKYPGVLYYYDRFGGDLQRLGVSLGALGHDEESLSVLRRCLKMRVERAARFPDVPEDKWGLAAIHGCLGWKLHFMRKSDESERHLREGLRLATEFKEANPDNGQVLSQYAGHLNNVARWNAAAGNLADAAEQYREVISIREKCVELMQRESPMLGASTKDAVADQHLGIVTAVSELLAVLKHDTPTPMVSATHRRRIKYAELVVEAKPDVLEFRKRLAAAYGGYMEFLTSHKDPKNDEKQLTFIQERAADNRQVAEELCRGSIERSEARLKGTQISDRTISSEELRTLYKILNDDYSALVEILEDDKQRDAELNDVHLTRIKYAELLLQLDPELSSYRSVSAECYLHYAIYLCYRPDTKLRDGREVEFAKKATELDPANRETWLKLEEIHRFRGETAAADAVQNEIQARFAEPAATAHF